MNTFKFLQTGGFPMDVNVLDQMQTAYKLFNALGALAGDTAIIKGCTITGNTVSDGVVYINGEILEFRSGILADNVIIVQEVQSKVFEDGNNREVYYSRYAAFGVATVSYPWAGFKRVFPTTAIQGELEKKGDKTTLTALVAKVNELEKKNAVFQASGGMVLWNKPANLIPAGWQEVTDFRGRMPVGFNPNVDNYYNESRTFGQFIDPEFANWDDRNGGRKTHQLTIDELPRISPINGSAIQRSTGWDGKGGGLTSGDRSGGGDYSEGEFIKPFGGDQPFSILNPYRVVLFIEYVG